MDPRRLLELCVLVFLMLITVGYFGCRTSGPTAPGYRTYDIACIVTEETVNLVPRCQVALGERGPVACWCALDKLLAADPKADLAGFSVYSDGEATRVLVVLSSP